MGSSWTPGSVPFRGLDHGAAQIIFDAFMSLHHLLGHGGETCPLGAGFIVWCSELEQCFASNLCRQCAHCAYRTI